MRFSARLALSFFVLAAVYIPCRAVGNRSHFQNVLSARQTVEGDGYGGEGYTVLPLLRDEEPATAIVIHGLGGSGEEWGFISLALSFFSLNYVKFIIPSAPEADVTYLNERMPSWFDIRSFDDTTSDVNRRQLLASAERIYDIIRGEISAGINPGRVFIIGFSQGGALALTSFLRSQWAVGGCVGVATWLPLETEYPAERSNRIRDKDILMLHGSEDEAVRLEYAERSRDILQSFGQNVNLTVLEGEPHVIVNTLVISALEDFIAERANGTTRYLRTLVSDLTDTFSSLSSRLQNVPGV